MFDIYPWQETQWKRLTDEVRQQRLPHALLLQGAAGLGKVDFAKAFSSFLLCDHTPDQLQACGQCRSCALISAGTHPDFYVLHPEEKSKSIKVDQLRRLIDQLTRTAQRGNGQVALLYPAESMNRAAANALLKTLEEPAGHVVIMLVCNRINTLPATVLSRCQHLKFSPPSADEKTRSWLQAQLNADLDPALLLKMADYAPLQALQLFEMDYLELRDQVLRHLLRIQRHETDPIAPVPAFLKKDLTLLLRALMTMVIDMVRLCHGVTSEHLFHTDRLTQLQSLTQKANVTKLQYYFMACQRAQAALHSGIAVNPQLLLENLFIEFVEVL